MTGSRQFHETCAAISQSLTDLRRERAEHDKRGVSTFVFAVETNTLRGTIGRLAIENERLERAVCDGHTRVGQLLEESATLRAEVGRLKLALSEIYR